MAKMYVMQGLPASGKSTKAKELIKTNRGMKHVSRDDIKGHSKVQEDKIISTALQTGHDVVVDDTNLNPDRVCELRMLSVLCDSDFEILNVATPPAECVKRDSKREKPVGAPAIWSMYHKYVKEKS